jgi:fucose permease
VGTILFGLGMSAIFPTVFSLLEHYVDVSGKQMSVMLVGIAFGEMLPPLALGYLTTKTQPSAFVYIILILMVYCCIFCCFFMHYGSKTEKSMAKTEDNLNTTRTAKSEVIELELDFD